MEIQDFIKARLDEREDLILNKWDSDGRARVATMWTERGEGSPGYTTVASDHHNDAWIANGSVIDDAENITVIWDPEQELAQIRAIRDILEIHQRWLDFLPKIYAMDTARGYVRGELKRYGVSPEAKPPTEAVLRVVAMAYVTHDDFDMSWTLA